MTNPTTVRVGVVDVYVVRIVRGRWKVLVLRRQAPGRSRSWETVHGRVERGESLPQAACRELREETGLTPDRLYSVTVHPFYLHRTGEVQLAAVFAAFVSSDAVSTADEHDAYEWLTPTAATKRFSWPREAEAIAHIRKLFPNGHGGAVDDVLRMPLDE